MCSIISIQEMANLKLLRTYFGRMRLLRTMSAYTKLPFLAKNGVISRRTSLRIKGLKTIFKEGPDSASVIVKMDVLTQRLVHVTSLIINCLLPHTRKLKVGEK